HQLRPQNPAMTSESSASKRFWRFSVRQLLSLAAVLCLLLAVLAPHVQNKFRLWREDRELWDSVAPQIALRRAIEAGQGADRVREALRAGAKVSMSMGDGSSLFHSAITRGQCENVEVLLDYGADVERSELYSPRPRTSPTASGRGPPLFAAIDCDQPTDTKIRMIRILLAHGADIRCEVGEENLMDLAALYGDGAIANQIGR